MTKSLCLTDAGALLFVYKISGATAKPNSLAAVRPAPATILAVAKGCPRRCIYGYWCYGSASVRHCDCMPRPKTHPKRVGTETFCPGRAGKQTPSREYHRHYKGEHHQREQDGDPQV
jgi:hypothetical protein